MSEHRVSLYIKREPNQPTKVLWTSVPLAQETDHPKYFEVETTFDEARGIYASTPFEVEEKTVTPLDSPKLDTSGYTLLAFGSTAGGPDGKIRPSELFDGCVFAPEKDGFEKAELFDTMRKSAGKGIDGGGLVQDRDLCLISTLTKSLDDSWFDYTSYRRGYEISGKTWVENLAKKDLATSLLAIDDITKDAITNARQEYLEDKITKGVWKETQAELSNVRFKAYSYGTSAGISIRTDMDTGNVTVAFGNSEAKINEGDVCYLAKNTKTGEDDPILRDMVTDETRAKGDAILDEATRRFENLKRMHSWDFDTEIPDASLDLQ